MSDPEWLKALRAERKMYGDKQSTAKLMEILPTHPIYHGVMRNDWEMLQGEDRDSPYGPDAILCVRFNAATTTNVGGSVHGGVTSLFMDHAISACAWLHAIHSLGMAVEEANAITLTLDISFKRAVPSGLWLRYRFWVDREERAKGKVWIRCDVIDPSESAGAAPFISASSLVLIRSLHKKLDKGKLSKL